MKSRSTASQLRILASRISELMEGLEDMNVTEDQRLKAIEGLLRLKKAFLETRLLEVDLRERLQERRGRAQARRAGLSTEALEEIGQVLGLQPKAAPLPSPVPTGD